MPELTAGQIKRLQEKQANDEKFDLFEAVQKDYRLFESCSLADCKSIPQTSGIYFLYDESTLYYVGQSVNLRKRLTQSAYRYSEKPEMKKGWIECPSAILSYLESFYIKKFRPLDNLKA